MSVKQIEEFMSRREETMMEMCQTPAAAEFSDILEATQSQTLDNSYAPSSPTPIPTSLSRGSSYSSSTIIDQEDD